MTGCLIDISYILQTYMLMLLNKFGGDLIGFLVQTKKGNSEEVEMVSRFI